MGIRNSLFGKRKTLPQNFEELLSKGNLQELMAVFKSCEANARGGYAKQTALAFDNCPHELAKWLVEQGGGSTCSGYLGQHTSAHPVPQLLW